MSEEELERIYTINLGKVLLSPKNRRAKRAINMIRQFASKHMKSETVKIEEEISHVVWKQGIRHPPRKIRVKITKDEDGNILVSKYQEEKKAEEKPKKGEKKAEEKPKKTEEKLEEKPKKTEEKLEEKPKKTEEKLEEKPKKTEEKLEEKPKKTEEKLEEKPKKTEEKLEEKPKKTEEKLGKSTSSNKKKD